MSISYGGDSIQFADGTNIASGNTGFVNKIINGAMVIDQRNAGASVTPTTDGTYVIDRFKQRLSASSKYSVQQVSSTTVGFTKSMKITSLAATSLGAGDYYAIEQDIEGFNVADLGWGTASAKTVTLSFVVNSSLTGTFGGCIQNGSANRSYPFTYTVSSANTDTTISVTIAGDTTGTWSTNNTAGLVVFFGLGVGSTYSGTAGAWAGANYLSATGATSVVGTSGATFYITGVDLRAGTYSSSPTWEFRSISQELALCQRYFWKTQQGIYMWGNNITNGQLYQFIPFPVYMRASPTVSNNWTSSTASGSIQSTSVHGINLGINATVGNNFSATYDTGNTINSEL